MDQATPPWRTFQAESATPGAAASDRLRPATPVVLVAGASLVLVAVALAAAVILAVVPAAAPVGAALGEPLGDTSAAGPGVMRTSGIETFGDPSELVVDVAGAVVRPGLHRLYAGARVGDAIEAAGGFALRADLAEASRVLNLAEPLADGAKVLVPELGTSGRAPTSAADGRVDLNGADQAALESLPGIGPVTAQRIIAAREERRFGSVRELRDRGLVGESVYGDIESLVRAG